MLKIIKSEAEYENISERIYKLIQEDIHPGSKKGDELELLSLLVQDYEDKHYKLPKPNPIEAIKFRLEQLGMSDKELNKILGARSRKSEILSGKRKLSLGMIRTLHDKLHIPADALIAQY